MDFSFTFSGQAAAEAMVLAIILVALFGGYGTWRILKAPPVPYLRSE
jgi:putative ABC transport system permease protein